MAAKGNIGLYRRYQEAWSRIKRANEQQFYFEAIAIEESILSNRLLSFLYGVGKAKPEEAAGKTSTGKERFVPFAEVIKQWRSVLEKDKRWEDPGDLIARVSSWREHRNVALHALTKSFPGKQPPLNLEEFLADAKATAEEGAVLADEVTRWQRRQLTRARKLGLV